MKITKEDIKKSHEIVSENNKVLSVNNHKESSSGLDLIKRLLKQSPLLFMHATYFFLTPFFANQTIYYLRDNGYSAYFQIFAGAGVIALLFYYGVSARNTVLKSLLKE